jgi:hypothetical protein
MLTVFLTGVHLSKNKESSDIIEPNKILKFNILLRAVLKKRIRE